MDDPTQPVPPPFPAPEPPPAVLAGDPRSWPRPPSTGMNKTAIGIAIGGCAFIFIGFIAFMAVLAWFGFHAAQLDRAHNRDAKRGAEAPAIDGKPAADGGGRSTDPTSWITSDDYPPDALNRGEQGTVSIAWEVSPDGLPMRCTVEQSSGHPSLDTAACVAIMRHAQFAPLPNGAVSVRRVTRRIDWRLPGGGAGK